MRNNAAGMAHEQESGMASHQFPIGQQIHEEHESIINRSCSQFAYLQERREQSTSSEYTLLPKTHFDGVLTNRNGQVSEFQSFIQAEEDTLILLHMDNETVQGHSKACDRTLDSDIVVLAVRFFETVGLSELRVDACSRNRYRDIPVQSLHSDPGRSKSLALTMLHSLERDATSLPSFQGYAVARIPLVHSGPDFLI